MRHFIRIIMLSVLTGTILSGNESMAQEKSAGNRYAIRLSGGADAGLPVGDFSDNYNWSIGASLQADFPVLKDILYATVNAGFHNFFFDDDNDRKRGEDLRLLPVKAGLKFFPIKFLYVQGEAGASFITNKEDLPTDKSAVFTWAPQVGTYLPLGGRSAIDAGFRYEGISRLRDNTKATGFLALRVAYSFSL